MHQAAGQDASHRGQARAQPAFERMGDLEKHIGPRREIESPAGQDEEREMLQPQVRHATYLLGI